MHILSVDVIIRDHIPYEMYWFVFHRSSKLQTVTGHISLSGSYLEDHMQH